MCRSRNVPALSASVASKGQSHCYHDHPSPSVCWQVGQPRPAQPTAVCSLVVRRTSDERVVSNFYLDRCCRHALEDGPKYVEPDQGDPYAGDDRGTHMS
jgi:hypothetical protein